MEQEKNNYPLVKVNIKKSSGFGSFDSEVIGRLVKTYAISSGTGLEIENSLPGLQEHVGKVVGARVNIPEAVVIEAARRADKKGQVADLRDQALGSLKRDWKNQTGIFAADLGYVPS